MTSPVPLTQDDIAEGLRRLGLGAGMIVEVHSSLSSLGWVEGGAETVVDALMGVVGEEGTLVMTAQPVSKPLPLTEEERRRGILAKVRRYGEDYDGPTGMGAIGDAFRRRPATVLGPGFHRVCAWGRDALRLSHGYAELLAADGHALLLGVDITRCSSMHRAERVGIPPEVRACFVVPDDIRRDYPDDIFIAYGGTPREAWLWVQAEAERRGLISRGHLGRAECRLFRAAAVVGIYEQALRTDPYALFGVERRGE